MNLCVYYLMSEAVMPRWQRTLAFQEKILPTWRNIPKVFIVDRGFSHPLPGAIVSIDLFKDGIIRFPQAKNAGMQWASEHGFSWVLDCDADTVILCLPTSEPSTGYSSMPCHFSNEGDTDEHLFNIISENKLNIHPSSRFLLRRDIFEKYKYDEEYHDWGWEDWDFDHIIMRRAGIQQSRCGAYGIHIWHPRKRDKHGNGVVRYQNRMKASQKIPSS